MNMTDAQRHLFALPKIVVFELTSMQRKVMDWVAYNEGRVAAWPLSLSRKSLRRLVERKLIKCVALSPARYTLTEMGRMVRGQRTIRHAMAAGRE